MKIINDINQYRFPETAVTLGKFDGVHLGHRLLADRVLAAEEYLETVLFTFDRPPAGLFSDTQPDVIFTESEKQSYVSELGIDDYVLYPFTRETADMEAEAFVRDILMQTLHMKKLVVGTDFRFGKGRGGDAALLLQLAGKYGYACEVVDKLFFQGKEISSTRIRESLRLARMEEVAAMLGRPYSITGMAVQPGDISDILKNRIPDCISHSDRELLQDGPTFSLIPESGKLLPPEGIYCTRVKIIKNLSSLSSLNNLNDLNSSNSPNILSDLNILSDSNFLIDLIDSKKINDSNFLNVLNDFNDLNNFNDLNDLNNLNRSRNIAIRKNNTVKEETANERKDARITWNGISYISRMPDMPPTLHIPDISGALNGSVCIRTQLFDCEEELYGKTVTVEFLQMGR